MEKVSSEQELNDILQVNPAVLLLFGGRDCGVCQAIKPQLDILVENEFPELVTVYLDCHQEAGTLCAARGIFALPVVQLWFEGKHFQTFTRVFSLGQIRAAAERPYQLLFPNSSKD